MGDVRRTSDVRKPELEAAIAGRGLQLRCGGHHVPDQRQHGFLRGASQRIGGGLADLGIDEIDEAIAALFLAPQQPITCQQVVVERPIVFLEHAVDRLRQQRRLGAMLLVPPVAHGDGDEGGEADDDPLEHGNRSLSSGRTGLCLRNLGADSAVYRRFALTSGPGQV
jgi:hypothetical protein